MIKKILLVLLILLALVIGCIVYLGTTTSGLRLVFHAAERFAPGHLSAGSVKGSLFRHINISDLHYKNKQLSLHVKEADIHWHLFSLFGGRLNIKTVTANHIVLKHFPQKPKSTPAPITSAPQKSTASETKTPTPFQLPFNISIHQLNLSQIHIENPNKQPTVIQTVLLSVHTEHNHIQLSDFQVKSLPYQLEMSGKLSLNASDKTNIQGNIQNFADTRMDAHFKLAGNLTQKISASIDSDQASLFHIAASVQSPLHTGILKATGQWQEMTWIFPHAFALTAEKGHLELNGTLNQYRLEATSKIFTDKTAPMHVQLSAQGSLQQLKIKTLTMQSGKGKATLNGMLAWQPTLHWQLSFISKQFNTDVWLPETHSALDIHLESVGQYKAKRLHANTTLKQFSGNYNHQTVSGSGSILYQNQQWLFQQVRVAIGDNHLKINGQLSKKSSLQWQIQIPQLHKLYALYTGNITSSGTLSGNFKRPIIKTQTDILKLKSNVFSANHLSLHTDFDSALQSKLDISLKANNVQWQWLTFKKTDLHMSGNKNQHNTALHTEINGENLSLLSSGTLQHHQLNETIKQINLIMKDSRHFKLNKPIQLTMDQHATRVSDFCWQSNHTALCAGGNFSDNAAWQNHLTLRDFDFSFFNSFLPEMYNIHSDIDSTATFKGKHGLKQYHGQLNMDDQSLSLHFKIGDQERVARLLLSHILVHMSSDKGLKTTLRLHLTKAKLPIEASFSSDNFNLNRLHQNANVTGKLAIDWADISHLSEMIPYVSNVKGRFKTTISLSGKLYQPHLNGTLSLTQTQFDLLKYGLNVRQLNLDTQVKDNFAAIKGSLLSKGKATFNGTMNVLQPTSSLLLHLQGNDLQLINNRHYRIEASPNIQIKLSNNGNHITGKLDIPHADLKPEDFTSTVTIPNNFRIVDYSQTNKVTSNSLYIDLALSLGKTIQLKYNGLNLALGGKLKLTVAPLTGSRGLGRIEVKKGAFHAYGKSLHIREGYISFNNSPMDDPSINLLAVTTIPVVGFSGNSTIGTNGGIIVGVQVSGSIQNLQIALYSEPTLSQSDILSYLLFGRPSYEQGSGLEALSVALAALSSGDGDGGFLKNTEKKLGLSSFGFQSTQLYTPSRATPQTTQSFVIGKKLSSNLEVLYMVGLNYPVNVIVGRYHISRKWLFQLQSSNYDNSGDLIYTFETD